MDVVLKQHVAADEVARIGQGAGSVCHVEHQILAAYFLASRQSFLELHHESNRVTHAHGSEIIAKRVIGKIPNIYGLVCVVRIASILTEEQIDTT